MSTSTKIRRLARLLEHESAVVWAINQDDELAYLSAGCSAWLGVDGELLIGRRCKAGTPISGDPLDLIAASLSPPPGFYSRGTASLRLHPPQSGGALRPETKEVRYVRVGSSENRFTLGIAGLFEDRQVDPEIQDAVAVRQRLDQWRQRQAGLGSYLLIGTSREAEKMRRRTEIACSVRTHVNLFQSSGGGAELLATHVHQRSAPGEPLIRIDGPLMDAELLDASVMPLINRLSDSESATGSILFNQLNRTSLPTQQRLLSLLESYPNRLRLIAICETVPQLTNHKTLSDEPRSPTHSSEVIDPRLSDLLDTIQITLAMLSARVEDLQLIAMAILGQYRVTGRFSAERISRPALDALVYYPWPNNFHELEETIRYASQNAIGEAIRVEDLPLSVRSFRPSSPKVKKQIQSLDEQVKQYEKSLLYEAMNAANQNRAEAARSLGISRSRLLRKLDSFEAEQMPKRSES